MKHVMKRISKMRCWADGEEYRQREALIRRMESEFPGGEPIRSRAFPLLKRRQRWELMAVLTISTAMCAGAIFVDSTIGSSYAGLLGLLGLVGWAYTYWRSTALTLPILWAIAAVNWRRSYACAAFMGDREKVAENLRKYHEMLDPASGKPEELSQR